MRYLIAISILLGGIFGPPSEPRLAREKYNKGLYEEALAHYGKALELLPEERQAIYYNMGQIHLKRDSLDKAMAVFKNAADMQDDPRISSRCWNNIGALLVKSEQLEPSLEAFKNALKSDFDNEEARFNYELVKKRLQKQEEEKQKEDKNQEEQKEENQEQKDQKQDKQQDDQQDQKKKQSQEQKQQEQSNENFEQDQGSDQQKKNQKGGQGKDNNEENIGEELGMDQAEMLLEAMDEQEKQFLQQLKKSSKVRQKKNDGPDW